MEQLSWGMFLVEITRVLLMLGANVDTHTYNVLLDIGLDTVCRLKWAHTLGQPKSICTGYPRSKMFLRVLSLPLIAFYFIVVYFDSMQLPQWDIVENAFSNNHLTQWIGHYGLFDYIILILLFYA